MGLNTELKLRNQTCSSPEQYKSFAIITGQVISDSAYCVGET